jgi:hypothetical protein
LSFDAIALVFHRKGQWLNNCIDTKAKCRHLKKWPLKGVAAGIFSPMDIRKSPVTFRLKPNFTFHRRVRIKVRRHFVLHFLWFEKKDVNHKASLNTGQTAYITGWGTTSSGGSLVQINYHFFSFFTESWIYENVKTPYYVCDIIHVHKIVPT